MEHQLKTTTRVEETHTLKLEAFNIIDLLNQHGHNFGMPREAIPPYARLVVDVPGGGDYSSCRLDIGAGEAPLYLIWTTTRTEGE